MIEVIWTKFSSFVKVLKLHCQLTNSQDWHFPSLWLLIIAKDSLLAEVSHDSLLSLVFCLVVRDLCLSRESQRSQNALIWLTGISDLLASVSNLSQDPFNRIFPHILTLFCTCKVNEFSFSHAQSLRSLISISLMRIPSHTTWEKPPPLEDLLKRWYFTLLFAVVSEGLCYGAKVF